MENKSKNKVKNKIFDHFGLKIVAVFLSILIWLIVMNVDDYKVSKQISGIPVGQLNGNVIEELDKVYDVTEGDTVDIIIKGRRSLVDTLTADDFVATADLSKMSITNTVQIQVQAKNVNTNNDITITCINSEMVLKIEDKISAQFPLTVVTTGKVADNYALGSSVSTPNIVTIEGPKSVVEKVTEIRATVDVSNKYTSFETSVIPVCYDIYGESMENKNLDLDCDEVNISISIYPTKDVPITVDFIGAPANGYQVTGINFHPQSIKIAGEKEKLDEVKQIAIRDIAVSGKSESQEINIDVDNYLPAGIYLADSNKQIAINVSIEKLVEKSITVAENDVSLINKDENYDYEVVIPNGFSIKLVGLNADITGVSVSNLKPYVDCSGLSIGENEISMIVSDVDNVSITNDSKIIVVVSEKTEEETTQEDIADTTEAMEN